MMIKNSKLYFSDTYIFIFFISVYFFLTISCLISFVDAVRKLFTAEKIFPSNVTVFQSNRNTHEKFRGIQQPVVVVAIAVDDVEFCY